MMIPHYYEDPHTLHVGTMPNRAYYIPASRRSDALVEHRETSDRFQLLNGSWKFRYYASIYDLQDAFYEVGYDASAFDSIPVPSVWQNHGYDHHQYTNIRYPFPADPPYVPKENPCGAYLYDFTYQKDAAAPRAFLNFEGVASCFYVWLNGQFVGYSQVAHSTSEFDVTKFLQNGTNHLAVLVLKWCDGSYMEDQDMFRMNGIFRDVYLLHRPEQCIEDYFITTDIHGSTAEVAVRLRYYDSAVATRITLYDAAGTIVGSVTPVEAPDDAAFPYHAEITVVDPTLWNAEQPYLYPGCELFYQDVQKVDGQHPHPVPPPEPRTVTPENKRTTKSPYRKAETGKSRFSGMGFAIGKGASRRLLCREEKLEQVKNEEKRKYNDKNQSSTSAQEAPGSARLAVSVGARWGKGEQ